MRERAASSTPSLLLAAPAAPPVVAKEVGGQDERGRRRQAHTYFPIPMSYTRYVLTWFDRPFRKVNLQGVKSETNSNSQSQTLDTYDKCPCPIAELMETGAKKIRKFCGRD